MPMRPVSLPSSRVQSSLSTLHPRRGGRSAKFGAVLGVLALALFVQGQAASATTITVTTTSDELTVDGNCSLREAITAANTDTAVDACPAGSGADTITLPTGTYTLSIPGVGEDANATGDLDITADLTISGAGAATTIVDGGRLDRVFHILAGTVAISGLTIQNGAPVSVAGAGGGILNFGTLTLNSSTVSLNSLPPLSGSAPGAGIANFGTLTVNSSTVSSNGGGGWGGPGGGIFNVGTLSLNNSTVSRNQNSGIQSGLGNFLAATATVNNSIISGNGGFGINVDVGPLTVNNSTVSDNAASGIAVGGNNLGGGGKMTVNNSTVSGNSGGGIFNAGPASIVNNSTVSGNSGSFSGGFGGIQNNNTLTVNYSTISGNAGAIGGIGSSGTLTVNNSTISGNSGSEAGGIDSNGTLTVNNSTISGNGGGFGGMFNTSGSLATLKNAIVANNSPDNCSTRGGGISSAGHNLSSDATCSGASGDLINTDPLLGPLANNGGPTQTQALLPGSPAIDAGSSDCPPPATDQRGVARPQGAACDIGAFELVQTITVSIDIKPGSFPNSINPTSNGKIPVAILSAPNFDAPSQVNTASLTFGRTGNESSLAFCNASPQDVNGDGLADLVCHFTTQQTGFQAGDTQSVLKGKTVTGIPIVGADSVVIVPPP